MKEQTRKFLEELCALMERYEVDIEVAESTLAYGRTEAYGLDISVVDPEEGYSDVVYIYTKFLDCSTIKELLK